ncbi:MAG: SDR family NAD(P)-dependent oxidoreductase [Bacteroidota bacterium]
MKQKTVLITGATSGIGKATAILLAEHGYRLVVCGRREAILNELVSSLKEKTEIHPLVFDVRDKEKVFQSIESLPKDFSQIDVLINNAGNAHGLDPIDSGSIDDWEAMLDINVKGLLYVSKAILPQMVKRKAGHIINIGSTAGKEVYPKGNVYCASKHAVDAINKGMRLDLNAYGIRVGAINPGLVETEFSKVRFKGDEERADTVYRGYQPLKPEDIADLVHFTISRPAHVNLVDLTVMPTAQASSTLIHKTLE